MVKCKLTSCIYSVLRINDLSFSLCFPAGQQISPKSCFNKCKKCDTQPMQTVCIEVRFLFFFTVIWDQTECSAASLAWGSDADLPSPVIQTLLCSPQGRSSPFPRHLHQLFSAIQPSYISHMGEMNLPGCCGPHLAMDSQPNTFKSSLLCHCLQQRCSAARTLGPDQLPLPGPSLWTITHWDTPSACSWSCGHPSPIWPLMVGSSQASWCQMDGWQKATSSMVGCRQGLGWPVCFNPGFEPSPKLRTSIMVQKRKCGLTEHVEHGFVLKQSCHPWRVSDKPTSSTSPLW